MTTTNSELLFARAKKVAPGGVHSPVRAFKNVNTIPRFISSASGTTMTDVDGNTYIDYCMSWGPLILGHQHPDIRIAIDEALSRGWTYGAAEPYSLKLAEFITGSIPWAEKIRFVSSGTEAVMSALRVARAATKRNKVLKFDGCYHGHVDAMMVRAGSGLAEMSEPDSAGIGEDVAHNTLVAPLADLESAEKILSQNDIAAVIIEPVPANNGLLLQTRDYLVGLADLCKRHGALLIFDEVISGFRVGFGGAAEHYGVVPDLVTYGKIVGGGFPAGAYAGRKDLMSLVAPDGPVYQAGTLSGNPVAMGAGFATLEILKRTMPYAELEAKTKKLCDQINKETLALSGTVPLHAVSMASLFWLICGDKNARPSRIEEIPSAQKSLFAVMYPGLLDRGYYLAPSGFEVGFMSTAHSAAQNLGLVEAITEVQKEIATK